MRIDGTVALITGASEGIGAACADVFLRRGARLALTARSAEKLRIVGGEGALILPADLHDPEARRDLIERALAHYGRIDILINNAGAGLYSAAWNAPLEKARELFDLNFFAALDLAQRVAPGMRAQRSGAIVNVSSIAGQITLPWFTLYSASKFALGSLTAGLRMELKQDGVHAMAVCPGYVQTSFQKHVLHGQPPEAMRRGRAFAITPERCAQAIARGLERNAHTVVTPSIGWIFIAIERLFPALVEWQLARMQRPAP